MDAVLADLLLTHFPPRTHPLTLVSDPDALLRLSTLASALSAAGFRTLTAADPVVLRWAWNAAQRVDAAHPLIIVTPHAVNTLPYDLWQQGVAVDLALHRFFPHLDTSLLAGLSLPQFDRLYRAYQQQPPARPLTRTATLDYVLLHSFGASLTHLATPGLLLRWLAELHAAGDMLPAPLRTALMPTLQRQPVLAAWPLADLLADPAALRTFVQTQWQGYIDKVMVESPVAYTALVPFATDPTTQAAVSALVSAGLLAPVAVAETTTLPGWTTAAVRHDAALSRQRQWQQCVTTLTQLLDASPATWFDWQAIARQWADLTVLRYDAESLASAQAEREYSLLCERIAPLFVTWLRTAYPQLAMHLLPVPHHLYHAPHYMVQRVTANRRSALLVLDGMSLAAWRVIWAAWSARHPTWHAAEMLLLAQVPTITAISRQALLAGQPPRSFADTLTTNQHEAAHWRRFWEGKGLPARAIAYASLSATLDRTVPDTLDSLYTRVQAVVLPDIDTMVHGATAGLSGLFATLRTWLDDKTNTGSAWVETLVQTLLDLDYHVTITSDHGHVEAVGIGQPQEGVTVVTRSKRARLYANERFARNVQESFAHTTLWHNDGILPDNWWALMPNGVTAFAAANQRVVTHGGLTLDECIVPLIEVSVSKASSQ